YRYDPLRESVTAKPALVMDATDASSANPPAVVWRRTTVLRIARDAHAAHRTIFEVENYGARRMAVLLPQDGIEIRQATIDDQPVTTLLAEEGRRMLVRLPANRRFVTVAVDYSLTRAAAGLSWFHRVNYLPLDADLPILTSRCRLYAPDGFAVVDSLDRGPFAKPLSWRERLFGSLARPADRKVFDPFRPATWPLFSRTVNENLVSKSARPSAPIPWNVERDSAEGTAEVREWSVAAAQAGAEFGNHVYLVDQRRFRALAWAIGLAMAVATWFWWPGHWTTRWALVALPAVAALLLPGLVAPLATAALAGVVVTMFAKLLSYGLFLFLPRHLRDGTGTGLADETGTQKIVVETGSSTFLKIGGFAPPPGILLFAVIALRLVVVSAQDQPVQQATAIHPVYIPIDKDRKPSGDTYYVSQALFDLLHRATGGWPQGQAGWMVSHATYAGNLQWEKSRNGQAVTNLTATYDLDVYRRRTEVRIALGNTAWKPDAGKVTLNGKPAEASLDGDGNQLLVQVDDVGTHRLVVPLTPAAGVVAATRQLDMPIPPVATAQLVLAVADNVPAIEVPSAWGKVVHDQAQGRLTAELGPAKRLALNWQSDGLADETDTLDVDQLVVLDLQPGAVVLRAKLKLNTNESRIRQLRLALDPELSPLPIEPPTNGDDGVGFEFVQTIPGDPQQMVLQFDRVISGRQTVELAFFVRDAVGVGNVRLPYLEVPGARTSRHWVVVSADGALRIDVNEVLPNPAMVAVERDALVEEWELPDTNAVLSYRQTQAKVDWSFPSHPQTP
ncbi:MAG: hypothetical protein OES79_15515, partial [Planctomycetota bacterium]|nr:hypothetical protein [Planctomycetota bacterium]